MLLKYTESMYPAPEEKQWDMVFVFFVVCGACCNVPDF